MWNRTPVASRSYGEEGGEPAALLRALLEEVDLRGVTVTLDAGHASYATEAALVEQNGADYLIGIKGNAPATLAQLQALDWRGAQRTNHRWHKAHGRWEWRKLEALDLQAPDLEAVRLRLPTRAPGAARDAPHEDEQARRGDRGSAVRDHVAAARQGRGAAAADAAPRALAGGEFQSLLARHDVQGGRQPHAHGGMRRRTTRR